MKRGFTLIELLAVIIILAIIAIIAVPIVINIINASKEDSLKRSAQSYLDSVETTITKENLKVKYNPDECKINEDGDLICSENGNELTTSNGTNKLVIDIKETKPNSGTIKLKDGKITDIIDFNLFGKYYGFDDKGNIVLLNQRELTLEPGLYDENKNLIATWEEFMEDYGGNIEDDLFENIDMYQFLQSDKYVEASILVISPKVTKIGKNAFSGCKNLEKIVIPDTVISIGYRAFQGCTNLKNITIPDSVTSIGHHAFQGCTNLTSIKIPPKVAIIEDSTFLDCVNLENVIFEDNSSLTTIEAEAFANTALRSIILPSGLTYIGSGAFHITPITSIIIPMNVSFIGIGAFYECPNLESVSFEGDDYWMIDGVVEFSPSELKDPTTNAEYFKETYFEYDWIRE